MFAKSGQYAPTETFFEAFRGQVQTNFTNSITPSPSLWDVALLGGSAKLGFR